MRHATALTLLADPTHVRTDRKTPAEGDIRLDNMMFYGGRSEKEAVIIDWSSAGCGPAADELAFFTAQKMVCTIQN